MTPAQIFADASVDSQILDTSAVTLSIVIPCLNEEICIGEFVDWCHQGLSDAGVTGEILIIDSSTDRSPEIAETHGARVLRVPKRGLGRAYIDAVPHIRGQYLIMGDCDLTYDFRQLKPFV
ncbi:MAG: glycosyltransferase, partial [Planctomycetota bacterium]